MKIAPTLYQVTGLIVLLFHLSGCLDVDDISGAWNKASPDPALEGAWKAPDDKTSLNDQYLTFAKGDGFYIEDNPTVEPLENPADEQKYRDSRIKHVRTLQFKGLNFLIEVDAAIFAKKKRKFPGTVYRYAMEDGKLVLYILDQNILEKAIASGKVDGTIPPKSKEKDALNIEPPHLARLDKPTLEFLAQLAAKPGSWGVKSRFERVDDLEKETAKSRTYPATADTPANTLVRIDLPDLVYFSKERADLLLYQLAADPGWRVHPLETGGIECYKTSGRTIYEGWDDGYGEKDPPSAVFLFSEAGPHREYGATVASPLDKETHIRLRKTSEAIESALYIETPGLSFTFFEKTQEEARVETRKSLEWLRGYLASVRAHEQEIKGKGVAVELLPEGAVRTGEPSMEVPDALPGLYNPIAYVNPGAPGYIYVKVFNVKTAKRPLPLNGANESMQLMGWSRDSSRLFRYDALFAVSGRRGDYFDARIELWFVPDDHSPERKLLEMTRKICGWEH